MRLFSLLLLVFSLLMLSTNSSYAQFEVSYWGNTITYPGVQLAYEHSLGNKQEAGRNQRRIFKGHLLRLESGRYHQLSTHTNTFVGLGWQRRTIRRKGFKFEMGSTLAYSRIRNKGATFEDIGNGQIEQVPNAGRSYVMGKFSIGIGQDFRAKNKSFAWHIRQSLAAQLPYNASLNLLTNLEAGMSFYFGKHSKIE